VAGRKNIRRAWDGEYYAAVWNTQTGRITVQTLLMGSVLQRYARLGGTGVICRRSEDVAPPYGDYRASIFDPATQKFNQVESMADGRWYATVTNLGDGTFMAFSGLAEKETPSPTPYSYTCPSRRRRRRRTTTEAGNSINKTVEFYKIGTGWSVPYTAPWTPPLYPKMHCCKWQGFFARETRQAPTCLRFHPNMGPQLRQDRLY